MRIPVGKAERLFVILEFFRKVNRKTDAFDRRIPLRADNIEIKLIRAMQDIAAKIIGIGDDIPDIPLHNRIRTADAEVQIAAFLFFAVGVVHFNAADLRMGVAGGAVFAEDHVAGRNEPDNAVFARAFIKPDVDRLRHIISVILIDNDVHVHVRNIIVVVIGMHRQRTREKKRDQQQCAKQDSSVLCCMMLQSHNACILFSPGCPASCYIRRKRHRSSRSYPARAG